MLFCALWEVLYTSVIRSPFWKGVIRPNELSLANRNRILSHFLIGCHWNTFHFALDHIIQYQSSLRRELKMLGARHNKVKLTLVRKELKCQMDMWTSRLKFATPFSFLSQRSADLGDVSEIRANCYQNHERIRYQPIENTRKTVVQWSNSTFSLNQNYVKIEYVAATRR